MKITIVIAVLLLTVMFSSPLRFLKSPEPKNENSSEILQTQNSATYQKIESLGYDTFKILIDGQIQTLTAKEYIMGVIAAEMPLSYNTEALKAQAVAAYTFACYRKLENENAEYDLTADSETDQAYISVESAKLKWGDNSDEYLDKLSDIVSLTENMLLVYDNKPALTVYHAISPGVTVDCEDVWGNKIPYLISVDSPGDILCEDYISSASFAPQELQSLLSTSGDEESAEKWFQNFEAADSGKVKSLTFCEKSFSGAEVAKLLGLRSSNFTVNFDGEAFVFTVKGYGHGVGMSQTGANYMAAQGADFKEILAHYYPDCTLKSQK